MTIEKTITKVEKITGSTVKKNSVGSYYVKGLEATLSFLNNNGEGSYFHVCRNNDPSDSSIDYVGGAYYSNVAQAIGAFLKLEEEAIKICNLFRQGLSVNKISETVGYTELAVLRITQYS